MASLSVREFYARAGCRYSDEQVREFAPELARLQEEGRGTAPEIVMAARSGEAPNVSKHLEWDNETAGERWREQQVRVMLGSYVVIEKGVSGQEHKVRGSHHIVLETTKSDEEGSKEPIRSVYMTLDQLKSDPKAAEYAREEAYRNLRRWHEKYSALVDIFPEQMGFFRGVFAAIDELELSRAR